jgi:hypothetical protein
MTAVCPACGLEFSNIAVSSGVAAFFEKLDVLDQQLFVEKAKKEAAPKNTGLAGAMLDRMSRSNQGISAGDKRKIEMIKNFPVPNSKEDIFEFIIMASSKINTNSSLFDSVEEERDTDMYNEAWFTKIKQVYAKAQILYASDKAELKKIDKILAEAKINPKRNMSVRTKSRLISLIVLAVLLGLILFALNYFGLL